MNSPTDESIDEMRSLIHELAIRVESQETELESLRGQLRPRVVPASQADQKRSQPTVSRAGMLKMAGIGAAAATAAGLDLTARGSSAFAATGDAVLAGKQTKAGLGTTVTYDGNSGFTGAVLLGSDSTYGNGGFSYPAAVAGIAGGGANAGTGGLVNGVYGYTERGVGNGVVGVNTNSVPGAGNGVLGVASATNSYGVHGTNADGTGVFGESSSPANDAAGVHGHHSDLTGGIGVHGSQAGGGWGGLFTSVSGIGMNASGGTGIGVNANGKTAVQAVASADPDSVGVVAVGSSVGVAATGQNIGVTASGSVTGLTAAGVDKFGVSASGPTAVVAEGSDIGVQASGGTAVIANGVVTGLTAQGTDKFGVSAAGPTAVFAEGSDIGLHGITNSTSAKAWGVIGEATSTSPNGLSAGVFGVSDSTTGNGMGVFGKHAGSGQGGHFQSAGGVGAACDGGIGRGGTFKGSSAALRLVPGSAGTHPVSGLAGDLFVDSAHRLWFCQQSGKRATWKKIA